MKNKDSIVILTIILGDWCVSHVRCVHETFSDSCVNELSVEYYKMMSVNDIIALLYVTDWHRFKAQNMIL